MGWCDTLEISEAPFLVVETNYGTEYVPGDLTGTENLSVEDVQLYVQGDIESMDDVEIRRTGVLWRLTEPGYMDSTEWSMAEDEEEAEAEAREFLGTDDDEPSETEASSLRSEDRSEAR